MQAQCGLVTFVAHTFEPRVCAVYLAIFFFNTKLGIQKWIRTRSSIKSETRARFINPKLKFNRPPRQYTLIYSLKFFFVSRSESKTIIRGSVGAGPEDAVVLGASLPRFLRALRPHNVTLFVSSRETERQLAVWREFDAEVSPGMNTVLERNVNHK